MNARDRFAKPALVDVDAVHSYHPPRREQGAQR